MTFIAGTWARDRNTPRRKKSYHEMPRISRAGFQKTWLAEQHAGRSIADVLTLHASLEGRRTLAIRHVNGHRLVALLEILSPANKDRARHLTDFAAKIASALPLGIHAIVIDLFPPGPHDPHGVHEIILSEIESTAEPYELPPDDPLTLASYVAGPQVDAYLEHLAIGASLPEMPLFLRPDRYVNVPLEATYQAAYEGVPAFWRGVLEGRREDGSKRSGR